MLIGGPLGEGSTASSTNSELWRAENSFLRMRGNSLWVFLPWLSRKFPPNLGQVEFTVVNCIFFILNPVSVCSPPVCFGVAG